MSYNWYKDVAVRNRGRLPHWTTPGGSYFVTFRLADSLPADAVRKLQADRAARVASAANGDPPAAVDKARIQGEYEKWLQDLLDRGYGSCALARDEVGEIVANAIAHFENQRYRLDAWCIMPNHAHVLLTPLPGHDLSDILQSWKSFTAKEANRVLGRTGQFWMDESYDHLIRDDDERSAYHRYILENPKKAGLTDWKWVWSARAP